MFTGCPLALCYASAENPRLEMPDLIGGCKAEGGLLHVVPRSAYGLAIWFWLVFCLGRSEMSGRGRALVRVDLSLRSQNLNLAPRRCPNYLQIFVQRRVVEE